MVIVLISGQTKEYTKLLFPVFQWDLTSPSRLSLVNMEILKINIKNTKWPHPVYIGDFFFITWPNTQSLTQFSVERKVV
jgi:hypothetical protein